MTTTNGATSATVAAERRDEVREIQHLMMPDNYVGRANRGRGTAQHHAGRPA